jgi:hypothetical protein
MCVVPVVPPLPRSEKDTQLLVPGSWQTSRCGFERTISAGSTQISAFAASVTPAGGVAIAVQ